MTEPTSKIIYTHTDEAPALATYSLLPVIQAFASAAGVAVETRDISLAGRILATFPDRLSDEQRVPRSEEHTSELQSQMRISYAVFCLKKKQHTIQDKTIHNKNK